MVAACSNTIIQILLLHHRHHRRCHHQEAHRILPPLNSTTNQQCLHRNNSLEVSGSNKSRKEFRRNQPDVLNHQQWELPEPPVVPEVRVPSLK